MLQQPVVAILVLLLGLAFCFAGIRLFRFLLPIWSFLVGFLLGADVARALFGSSVAAALIGGLIVGIIAAALSIFLYEVAVALLVASVGAIAGVALVESLGGRSTSALVIAALIGGAIGLIVTIALHLPRILVIVFTALAGASGIVAGLLLLLQRIALNSLAYGTVGATIRASGLWGIVWLVLAAAGMVVQTRSSEGRADLPQS